MASVTYLGLFALSKHRGEITFLSLMRMSRNKAGFEINVKTVVLLSGETQFDMQYFKHQNSVASSQIQSNT